MRGTVVYTRAPSGHASVAAALKSAFRQRGHDFVCVNIAAEFNPILGPFLDKTYAWILNFCPWLWDAIYDRRALLEIASAFRHLYWSVYSKKILATARNMSPDVIICTHAAPFSILALAKKRGELKSLLVACPTDYVVHSFWMSPEADLYLAPNQHAAERLAVAGISPNKIIDAGIPVDPALAGPRDKIVARRSLGLQTQNPVFLLSGGSRGLGRVAQASFALLKKFPQAQVAVLCGENQGLRSTLQTARQDYPRLRPYGRVGREELRLLLTAADFFVGKAGGVSLAEAAATGVPVALFGSLPGQEKRNELYWIDARVVLSAKTANDLCAELSKAMSNPEITGAMLKNMAVLSRPNAAQTAVEAVEKLLFGKISTLAKA